MPSRRLGGHYDSQRGGRKQKRQTGAQTQKQQANKQAGIHASMWVIACLYTSCDCISVRLNSRDPLSASFRLQKVALHPLLSTHMIHFLSPPSLQLNRVSYFLIALLPANFPYLAPCASSPLLTPSCVSAVCGQMWGWTLAPECLDVPCVAQA